MCVLMLESYRIPCKIFYDLISKLEFTVLFDILISATVYMYLNAYGCFLISIHGNMDWAGDLYSANIAITNCPCIIFVIAFCYRLFCTEYLAPQMVNHKHSAFAQPFIYDYHVGD